MSIRHSGIDASRGMAGLALAAALAGSLVLLPGCATSGASSSSDEQATSELQQDAQANDAEDTVPAGEGRMEGDAALGTWADECLDRRGDVTVYALAELKGGQLSALMQQQDYSWDERNRMWVKEDGSAAVVVNGADGKPLASDKISELDAGAVEGSASYRIVTSGYSNAKKTFDALAKKVMECEDVEYADNSAVGVVHGPSLQRCLVFVSKSHDVFTVTMLGEEGIKAGFFDQLSGQELGGTVDEVFEALAGRAPGAE